MSILIVSIICISAHVSYSAQYWAKAYGGSDNDMAYSVWQTTDGGYIIAGYTYSYGAGSYDVWVLKLNSSGNITWQKTYGGSDDDRAYSIQQTADGGYIVAGNTQSFGAESNDFWVLRLGTNGSVLWQETFGTSGSDIPRAIKQTDDNDDGMKDDGYIVSGECSCGLGGADIWIVKLDSVGQIAWQKAYGGSNYDGDAFIQQTTDGGYIILAETTSFGISVADLWVLKLDGNGNVGRGYPGTWRKTYGGCGE